MGNGAGKLKNCCFSGCGVAGDLRDSAVVTSEPYDEGLGHSFCYVRPDPSIFRSGPSKVHHSDETATFRSISGAAVSANAATPLSTAIDAGAGAAFESSTSFSSASLQPVPRFSGPLSGPLADRGFLSSPIERAGFMSGPLDGVLSRRAGPLRRSFSHGLAPLRRRAAASLIRSVTTVISRSISAPLRESVSSGSSSTLQLSSFAGGASECCQWAQGRAGEDRVHVVISEEHGWLFVGIYDGFNGPDATDYLLCNLYSAVQQEVKGLLWVEDKKDSFVISSEDQIADNSKNDSFTNQTTGLVSPEENAGERCRKRMSWGPSRKYEDNQKRWKYEWFRERLELDRSVRNQLSRSSSRGAETHPKVLKALSIALKKTEEAFLEVADLTVSENPELALMGSCVLVMVMKGEDVYLMNVGDSRAVLGKKAEPDIWDSVTNERLNLQSINEETLHDLENYDCSGDQMDGLQNLVSLQLTKDHSTSVEEVERVRSLRFFFSLSLKTRFSEIF